jgi:DNA-binding NtrC family response regulator
MQALLLDPDLFFAVKVSAALKHMEIASVTARTLDVWMQRLKSEHFVVALVNISARGVAWEQAISEARARGIPVIAYGSHVETEAQAQARSAGATRVIANSKLATDLPTIVERTLQRAQGTGSAGVKEDDA